MKFKTTKEADAHLAEINIIPMVDIMLVLLIIFMVTAPMLQEGIEINLPEVSAASVEMTEEDFVLSVDDLGHIFINDNTKEKYSILSIEEKLRATFENKPNKVLYLRGDQSIKYGYIMEIMAACRRAGVEKIGMITETAEEKENSKKKQAKLRR